MDATILPASHTRESESATESDAVLLERYVSERSGAALSALIKRHRTSVNRICKRVLGDSQDVDDAVQSTFLLLMKKSASIANPHLLRGWLCGVAFRNSLKIKAREQRRREAESRVDRLAVSNTTSGQGLADHLAWDELRMILDEEIRQLPDKYRRPLVLCYFDGRSHVETAKHLGCPTGSISRRLDQARAMLRRRLARRGVTASVPLLILLLARRAASADETTPVASLVGGAGTPTAKPAQRVLLKCIAAVLAASLLAVGVVAGAARIPVSEGIRAVPGALPTNTNSTCCYESMAVEDSTFEFSLPTCKSDGGT